jgi:hypothetical protein
MADPLSRLPPACRRAPSPFARPLRVPRPATVGARDRASRPHASGCAPTRSYRCGAAARGSAAVRDRGALAFSVPRRPASWLSRVRPGGLVLLADWRRPPARRLRLDVALSPLSRLVSPLLRRLRVQPQARPVSGSDGAPRRIAAVLLSQSDARGASALSRASLPAAPVLRGRRSRAPRPRPPSRPRGAARPRGVIGPGPQGRRQYRPSTPPHTSANRIIRPPARCRPRRVAPVCAHARPGSSPHLPPLRAVASWAHSFGAAPIRPPRAPGPPNDPQLPLITAAPGTPPPCTACPPLLAAARASTSPRVSRPLGAYLLPRRRLTRPSSSRPPRPPRPLLCPG